MIPTSDRTNSGPHRPRRYVAATRVESLPEEDAGQPDVLTVPSGTIPEVLGWVGGDPARALEALEFEHDHSARPTLIVALEDIVDAGTSSEDADVEETAGSDEAVDADDGAAVTDDEAPAAD